MIIPADLPKPVDELNKWIGQLAKIIKKDNSEIENFIKPEPSENINPILLGKFPEGDAPHSILHYIDKNNPLGQPIQNPNSDPMYIQWEEGIKKWLNLNN